MERNVWWEMCGDSESSVGDPADHCDLDEKPHGENIVVVALPEKYEEGKSTLKWALKRFSDNDSVYIAVAHVYIPSRMIPIMETEIDVSHLGEELVNAYRKIEREKLNSVLNKYLSKCRQQFKFRAFKLLVEADDFADGLLQIIRTLEANKLVMGAAPESRTEPSERANKLMREAGSSCKIWFAHNGKLIFTTNVQGTDEESSSSRDENGEYSENKDNGQGEMGQVTDPYENFRKRAYEEFRIREDGKNEMFWSLQRAMLLTSNMSNESHLKEMQWKKEIEEFLERAKQEKDTLRQENEQLRQENQLLKSQRDENLNKLLEVTEQKTELENRISHSKLAVKDMQIISAAARNRNDSLEAENKSLREKRDNAIRKAQGLQRSIDSLEAGIDKMRYERNNALREMEQLRNQREQMNSGPQFELNYEFSLEELNQATENFSDSRKIGEGGFGCVYKGFLRNTTVAVKKLNPQSLQDRPEFEQEVAILRRVRHPNIVTLIGACSEASALVYEYLPNGSLEDRLMCKGNTTPHLTWQARTRIIGEICSALIFLHSTKPHPVVHGDLKPDNILLDANLVSKLGDFGISRLLNQSSRAYFFRMTAPKGTFLYMDPAFANTGELTTKSDVYSLGIIILRLLTGQQPLNIVNKMESLSDDELKSLIDPSAGQWPFVQAKKLARLGLRCANKDRRTRPNLLSVVWPEVEPMMRAASSSVAPCLLSLNDNHTPSYFICPIVQDVMKEPHMAGDGHTYELQAIKNWFDSGHNTSPMTNLPLPNLVLIPNHALRSAIQEWNQKHPGSQSG